MGIMDYFSGWCKSEIRLIGKTAIVTGANSGIGKETALDFYSRGARVIMACRNETFGKEAKMEIESQGSYDNSTAGYLVLEKLDLASLTSVRQFSQRVLDSENHIHILVNNAGVMMCPRGSTEDGFETHMGTNHLGHALLTLLLLPKLRSSAPSRILYVSSRVHESFPVDLDDLNFEKKPYNAFEAYCRSKSANILFARELAGRLKSAGVMNVTTYSLHPGIVHTELGRHFSSTVWPGATWVWHHLLSWFLKSPRCGAQTSIYCALDEGAAEQSGLYYSDCDVMESSKETQDEVAGRKLWDLTIGLLQLQEYNLFTEEYEK